ncbi:hypothetical protein GP486_002836, partial [Trichoglossum hirsutum]
MAARNRPRALKDDDAHEERNMWNQILNDLKRCKNINSKAAEITAQIRDAEERAKNENGELSLAELDALQALYRDGVKLAEQEQAILKDEPNRVIPNLGILTALRAASESDTTRAAPASSVPPKSRNPKRKLDETPASNTMETPTQPSNPLSTSVSTPGGHTRLKATTGRSGSVPSVAPKEAKDVPALKIEEPVSASTIESVGTPSKIAGIEKSGASLKVGTEVAFRNNKHKGLDGEFIQCTVISVVGDGVKKRYEIQDPEPDDNGNPGQIYKASAAYIIPIPPSSVNLASLPDFQKGKQVLARYPETTTFYKAEVMGMKKTATGYFCRLRFEGEEEKDREVEVERRYVLDVGSK